MSSVPKDVPNNQGGDADDSIDQGAETASQRQRRVLLKSKPTVKSEKPMDMTPGAKANQEKEELKSIIISEAHRIKYEPFEPFDRLRKVFLDGSYTQYLRCADCPDDAVYLSKDVPKAGPARNRRHHESAHGLVTSTVPPANGNKTASRVSTSLITADNPRSTANPNLRMKVSRSIFGISPVTNQASSQRRNVLKPKRYENASQVSINGSASQRSASKGANLVSIDKEGLVYVMETEPDRIAYDYSGYPKLTGFKKVFLDGKFTNYMRCFNCENEIVLLLNTHGTTTFTRHNARKNHAEGPDAVGAMMSGGGHDDGVHQNHVDANQDQLDVNDDANQNIGGADQDNDLTGDANDYFDSIDGYDEDEEYDEDAEEEFDEDGAELLENGNQNGSLLPVKRKSFAEEKEEIDLEMKKLQLKRLRLEVQENEEKKRNGKIIEDETLKFQQQMLISQATFNKHLQDNLTTLISAVNVIGEKLDEIIASKH